MRRTSELIGKAIVSADRGEKMGRVADVLVDPDGGRLAGLVVRNGLLRREAVLPYEDVNVLGQDAVVARSRDAVTGAAEWRKRAVQARRSMGLRNRRVITRAGREVGTISDVYIDEQSGRVDGYEVATQAFAGLVQRHTRLPFSNDLAIGDDAVVVPDNTGDAVGGDGSGK